MPKNKKIIKAKKPVVKKSILTKKIGAKKPIIKKTIKTKNISKKPLVKNPVAKKSTKKNAVKSKIITKKIIIKKPVKSNVKAVLKSSKNNIKEVKKNTPKTSKKTDKKQTIAIKKIKKQTDKKVKIKESKTTKSSGKSLAKRILAKKSEKKKEEIKAPEKKEIFYRSSTNRRGEAGKSQFKIGDHAIYPSHGLGKIIEIEKTKILGQEFSCYLMYFEKEKLMIKIPTSSAERIGLRHPISKPQMDEVFVTLRSGVKKLKGMWSRRAQEYETKINSGDIMLLAEVLRDLTRDIDDSERSYSERIIYETAIHRLASEYSIIYDSDFEEAKDKIINTAKDKLNSEPRSNQKDEFDDFDLDGEENEEEESEEEEDEEYGDEEDDYDFDDDDDEKPKKKKKKK
jgi:CarD family transcriptional regulator